MKACDICGTLNFKENNYCIHCGNKLILEHVCPHCGEYNPDVALHCVHCGAGGCVADRPEAREGGHGVCPGRDDGRTEAPAGEDSPLADASAGLDPGHAGRARPRPEGVRARGD